MEGWEVEAAIQGYGKHTDRTISALRAITFSASRFNASATAMSKKQAQKIGTYKFPWEKQNRKKQSKGELMTIFKAIAKATAKNE